MMETVVLPIAQLTEWVRTLSHSPIIAILFAGDRILCCDEAVAIQKDGKIVGVATIAPKGEGLSGVPTIVALYILPVYRRKGYGKKILEAAINRCIERGFPKIRVDVMSSYAMAIIDSLDKNLFDVVEVHNLGNVMDYFVHLEEER